MSCLFFDAPTHKSEGVLRLHTGSPTPYRMGYSYSFQNLPFFLEVPDKLRIFQTEGQHLDLKKKKCFFYF